MGIGSVMCEAFVQKTFKSLGFFQLKGNILSLSVPSYKVSHFIADLKWTSMDQHLHLLLETFCAPYVRSLVLP